MHPRSTFPCRSAFLHSRTSAVHYRFRQLDHWLPCYPDRTGRKARFAPLPSSPQTFLQYIYRRKQHAGSHRSTRAAHEHRSVNAPDCVFRSFRLRVSRIFHPAVRRPSRLPHLPPRALSLMNRFLPPILWVAFFIDLLS